MEQEFLLEHRNDLAQASVIIAESIEADNSIGPHPNLEYKMPDALHQASEGEFRNRTQLVS